MEALRCATVVRAFRAALGCIQEAEEGRRRQCGGGNVRNVGDGFDTDRNEVFGVGR